MRFVLTIAAALSVSAFAEEDFDPKNSLNELLEKTKAARSEFERESSQIDSLLERVVGRPERASLVELKSASQLASERRAFEQRKTALLQKDNAEVSAKEEEFKKAMKKLRQDTASLVGSSKPASFIEVKSKYADGNIQQFYADSQALVDKVRSVAESIRTDSEVVVNDVHKRLLDIQTHH